MLLIKHTGMQAMQSEDACRGILDYSKPLVVTCLTLVRT